jgi:hypothetical protein
MQRQPGRDVRLLYYLIAVVAHLGTNELMQSVEKLGVVG